MSQLATCTPETASRSNPDSRALNINLCHFTTAHTELKSRTFHREFLPLAEMGIAIQYLAPIRDSKPVPGVTFVPTLAHSSRARRTLAFFSLLRGALRQNARVYHFQDPELIPLGLALKLLFRKRLIYDAYEDFPSMVANKASVPRVFRKLMSAAVDRLEHLAARSFDGVMTADPFTLRRLSTTGESRKLVFYNFPNLDFFPAPRAAAKRFDVVYRGGLSDRAGTFVLLEAMKLLADRRAKPASLLLIGYPDDTAAELKIREQIRVLGLQSWVTIQGRIDHEHMAEALSGARVGVCPLQPVPKFLLNIPVKVFEYWACGLPVVASDLPPIRPFFRGTRSGSLFQPGHSSELAGHIGWLLDHPDAATRMGREGRKAVEERFNNQREALKLRHFVIRIASKP